MSEVQDIRERALLVKNATQEGENTADRVGGVLLNIVDRVAEMPSSDELVEAVQTIVGDMDIAGQVPVYDDTAIQNKITELEGTVSSVSAELDNEAAQLNGRVDTLSEKADTIKGNLDNKINEIEQQIAAIETGGGSQDSEALVATINTVVDEKVAGLNLDTIYAKTGEAGKILEWMYSGLKAQSTANKTYSELVSAAKNNSLGTSAIAGLQTQIDSLGDTYVATSQLNTKVNDALASLIQEVKPGASATTLINQIGTNEEDIAAISNRVETLEGGGYLSETDIVNALGDNRSRIYSSVNSLANTAATGAVAQLGPNSIASALAQATDEDSIAALQAKFGSTIDGEGIDNLITERLKAYATGTELDQVASTASANGSAISALQQRTQALEDGDFVSSTEIWDIVKNDVNGAISNAGYVSTADFNSAKQTLQTSIGNAQNAAQSYADTQLESYLTKSSFTAITGLQTTEANVVSGLKSTVKTINDNYVASSALLTSVESQFQTKYQSGLVSQSDLTGAVTGLIAEETVKNNYVAKASIIASINSSGESDVAINADRINFNDKIAFDASGNATFTGDIVANSLTLGSNATISYSKLTGTPTIPSKTSDLTNDSSFATTGQIPTKTSQLTNDNNYATVGQIPSLTGYIKTDGTIGSTPADGATGFTVSSDGLLQASNAIIYGKLYSSEGTIGGWTIGNNRLYSEDSDGSGISLDADGSITSVGNFRSDSNGRGVIAINEGVLEQYIINGDVWRYISRFDSNGSGYLASGNFKWDSAGSVVMGGDVVIGSNENASSLLVEGNTTIEGVLFVESGADIGGDVTIGTSSVNNNLTVYGNLKTSFITEDSTNINIGGGGSNDSYIYIEKYQDSSNPSYIDIASASTINLSANDTIDVTSNELNILADTTIGKTLKGMSRNLIVHGEIDCGDLDADNAIINSDLKVTGTSTFGNNVTVDDDLTVNGQIINGSDERIKDIVKEVTPSIEDIANARIVDYKLKVNKDEKVYTGSIAQDWQNILPNAVSTNKEGYLGLNYQAVSVVSAVTAAREIVKLKQENEELKARLAAIEKRLESLTN